VLVVEYGQLNDDFDILIPERTLVGNARNTFNWTSLPVPGLANRTFAASAGSVVGGSSAINGMFFDRGSEEDYDAWEKLGNPSWGWEGLLPYFKKVETNILLDLTISTTLTWLY
jgi:choline dehydrogenase-like flavoprotein